MTGNELKWPPLPPSFREFDPVEVALTRATRKEPERKKTPTYNLTMEQIEGIKRRAVDEAVNEALILMLGLPTMVLRDKHGFDDAETDRFVDGVTDLYDSYQKGYITLKDVEEVLKEEAGVSFVKELRKKR